MASNVPADVHVLLVDDDRVTRTVVAGLLREMPLSGCALAPSSPRTDPSVPTSTPLPFSLP